MPSLGALSVERWDAVVVGAGIAGCAAAYDLASRGYRTLLIDKSDIGSGTSQATTNLIHGGLRYLKRPLTGIPLVRTALRERNWLRKAAPHLVEPLEFLIPVYDWSPDSRLALKAGMTIYDWFSGGKPMPHQMLSADAVRELEPLLVTEGLRGGARYADCQVRPERLCLAYAQSAEQQGAVIRTYLECTDIYRRGDTLDLVVRDEASQEAVLLGTRCLVNASGPWLDELCQAAGDRKQKLTLTKGVHIIHPLVSPHAVYAPSPVDGRYVFCLPWRGFSLIGTTDTRHAGSPSAVPVTSDDVRYLIGSARSLFPGADIGPERIVAATAGLRPLRCDPSAKESDISRDYSIAESGRVLSLIGVKLTTARAAAEDLGGRVNRLLKHDRKSTTASRPLYGGGITSGFFDVPDPVLNELRRNYGEAYDGVLAFAQGELCERICSCKSSILAEAAYAARHEHVTTVQDFLRRRTRSDLCTCGADLASRVVPVLARELGWGAERQRREIEAWHRERRRMEGWKNI
jgi:glycerol-3-phosphate dehydrogenase